MSRLSLGVTLGVAAVVGLAVVVGPGFRRARFSDGLVPVPAATAAAPMSEAPLDKMRSLGYVKGAASDASLQAMVSARKLIRTAQVAIEVSSYEAAADQVGRLAEAHGGYLADAQAARGGKEHRRGTLTIRVPADRFAAAYAALKSLGKVETETVATQDVTKAYADLETRLAVKRDAEARLREILRTRTARLADILEAERELTRITEEIEQTEGERRYYDQQVALSTISAALYEPEAVIRPGALAPLVEAFRDSVRLLAESAAALLYVLVLVLPWGMVVAAVWLTVRAVRRRSHAGAGANG
jgi:hypothetical protein